MKPLLFYLFGTLFCSGLFVALYRLLLVGHLSFAACRRYLLAACALSLLLPALRIPLYPAPPLQTPAQALLTGNPPWEEFVAEAQPAAAREPEPGTSAAGADNTVWTVRCATALYMVVTTLLLILLFRRWRAVRRLRRRCVLTRLPDYTLAEGVSVRTPFSFLRTIFLPPGFSDLEREQIVCHEASHVRHRHTAERLVAEVVSCFCWYNPFLWMIVTDLREVQEWEADRDVLDRGYDLLHYRMLIFRQLFGYGPDLICGLNHSFTKKRFLMMTHAREGKHAFVRLCALVPAVAAMLALCSFTTKTPGERDADPAMGNQPVGAEQQPVHSSAEIRISGERILLDDQPVTLADLPGRLRQVRAEGIGTVMLTADPDMPMRRITEVKEVLREGNVLKVHYRPVGMPGISRVLPPPYADGQPSVVQVIPDEVSGVKAYPDGSVAIKQRNLMQVLVDDQGDITVGPRGKKTDLASLKQTIVRFLRNAEDDAGLSEKQMRAIPLPDGGTWNYPVSLGVVSFRVSDRLDYATYVAVLDAVTEAFREIRNEVSRSQFGREYDALGMAEREAANRAVPICIAEAESVK